MTTTALTIADQAVLEGKTYTVSQNTDLAGGSSTSMLLENPSGSGTAAVIYFGEVVHEGELETAVFTNVDSISGGTSEDIAKNNIDSDHDTALSATQDASYNTTDEHHRVVYTGTGSEILFNGYKMVLEPGNNVVVELTNPKSNNDQTGIRMAWAEKPE